MNLKALTIAAVMAMAASAPNAATIDQTLFETYTEIGETLSYKFTDLEPIAENNAALTIFPTGGIITGLDLAGLPNEFFDVTVDGSDFGRFSCDGNTGSTVIPVNDGDGLDCVFTLSLETADFGFDFNANVADGVLEVLLAFGDGVNTFLDNDQVAVRLTNAPIAPVPLPAGALLLVSALVGLVFLKGNKGNLFA